MGRGRVTAAGAAAQLGVARQSVFRLVAQGELPSHGHRAGGAFDVVDVLALSQRREAAAAASQRARRQRDQAEPERPGHRPPDDVHEWLNLPQVAEVLGVTRQAVARWCQLERLPYSWSAGWRWVRRDLLELWIRARSAEAVARTGVPPGWARLEQACDSC